MLSLVFFWVVNFDARYFFGCKISGSCIFLGWQYEAMSDLPLPPVMYTASTPPPLWESGLLPWLESLYLCFWTGHCTLKLPLYTYNLRKK